MKACTEAGYYLYSYDENSTGVNGTGWTVDYVDNEGLTYCRLPSWDDFALHFTVCSCTFGGLCILSLLLSACRGVWQAEFVVKALRPLIRIINLKGWYMCFMATVSLNMCVLHVVHIQAGDAYGNAFDENVSSLWNMVELVGCYFHGTEALILWLFATANSAGGASGLPVKQLAVDSLVVPSVLLRHYSKEQLSHFSFSYFACLRTFGLWCSFRSSLAVFFEGVRGQLIHASVVVLTFIFVTGMLLQQMESLAGTPWPIETAENGSAMQIWSMDSSIYFVLMTITTVGYGDLWPSSAFGQIFTIVISLRGIYLMMQTFIGVIDAVSLGWGGGGQYERSTRNRHAVVAGNPSRQVLVDFIDELYHPDHAHEAEDLNLVILLNPGLTSTLISMRKYLQRVENRRLASRVWLLQGSAVKRRDLDRVGYKDAMMAWLLPNLYARDTEREDVDNAMRALAMRRHTRFVRIAVLLSKAENRSLLTSVGIPDRDIVVAGEIKAGILGKAAQVQGFAAWAGILLKNTAIPEHLIYDFERPWFMEYLKGLQNELYETKMSPSYAGAPFGAIASDILDRSDGRAFLIGFIEEAIYPGDQTVTYVFPGGAVHIGLNKEKVFKGIFIASCREDIRQHPPDTNFQWNMTAVAKSNIGDPTDLSLPGVVPQAAPGTQGIVKRWFELEAESAESIETTMVAAAKLQSARGIQSLTKISDEQAEYLVGGIPADAAARLEGAQSLGGDQAKALFDQHLEAQKEVAREAEALSTEKEVAKLEKTMAIYKRATDLLEQEVDDKWFNIAMNPDEQAIDDELWGQPPKKPPQLLGNPQEPPVALLVHGGHVLVLGLEAEVEHMPDCSLDEKGQTRYQTPGAKHGLAELVAGLRQGIPKHRARPLVLLANQVPSDWASISHFEKVYLVQGPPLSGTALRRAGLCQAHTVVVHQSNSPVTDDPRTVDSRAVFACRLVESMITDAGKDIPVICDLLLDRNAFFIPAPIRTMTHGRAHLKVKLHDKEKDKDKEEEEQAPKDKEKKLNTEDNGIPFYYQTRFATGQLFVSSVVTAAAVNMMYNPSLASIFREILKAGFMVLPLDDDWKGGNYNDLFAKLLRRRNLLAVGLLRHMDYRPDADEDFDDEELNTPTGRKRAAAIAQRGMMNSGQGLAGTVDPQQRWTPQDTYSERFVLAMPPGDMKVAPHDGIICMLPMQGKAVLPSREELIAPPCT